MLTLTQNASAVVKQIADQTSGDGSGLRISQQAPDTPTLDVEPTAEPQPGDQVVEAEGARVFLEEQAAVTLDTMVLDAQVDQAGSVQFSITPQDAAPQVELHRPSPGAVFPPRQRREPAPVCVFEGFSGRSEASFSGCG